MSKSLPFVLDHVREGNVVPVWVDKKQQLPDCLGAGQVLIDLICCSLW
jgi:hypothetical protein